MMRILVVLIAASISTACTESTEPQSLCKAGREKKTEEWCEQMLVKPNGEWQEEEFEAFSCDCLDP